MHKAGFSDNLLRGGVPRMALTGLLAAIAAVALGDLLEVVARLRTGLDASVEGGGLALVLVAAAMTSLVLAWLVRGPVGDRIDPAALLVGLGLLIGLRIAAVILVDAPLIVDWLRYHELAASISQGGDWFANRPSGYSMLLSVGYRIFGPNPVVGEWLNVGLGLASGLLVYALALRAAGSRAAGVALVLYAVAPAEILMTPVLGTEIAYGALLVGVAWVLLAAPPTVVRAAIAGAVLGASQYVRATSQVMAPFLAIAAARLATAGRRWLIGLVFAASFVGVLAPVIVANIDRGGGPSISTSSFSAWQLLIGSNQEHDGRFNADDVALVGGEAAAGTVEAERIAMRVALERIGEDPIGTLGLVARKFPVVWGDAHYGARWALHEDPAQDPRVTQTFVLLSQLAWVLVAALAAVGAWRKRAGSGRTVALLGMVLVVFVLIHALGEANPRYHAPLVPIFSVLAGIGAAGLLAKRET